MIEVDISNIWGQVSLPELLSLEAEIAAAHQSLDEIIGSGNGPAALPQPESIPELQHLLTAAERIREESDVCVIVGGGSACLGAQSAIELLLGPQFNLRSHGPEIFFTGSHVSTRHHTELTRLLEGRDVSLVFISESSCSPEPKIAFRNLRWLLERRYGTDEARRRIYVVTDDTQCPLYRMAQEEDWDCFSIPRDESGRFSLLTAAGLLPMAVAGIDIAALLRGASRAWETLWNLRSFENAAWLYAATRNLLFRKGCTLEILESFEPGFRTMGRWWQQLFAGIGSADGRSLVPVYAELPANLRFLSPVICQAPRSLFETMVRFEPSGLPLTILEDVRDPEDLNYLSGKTLDEVQLQACLAALDAHTDIGISAISIHCGPLSPEALGALISFFLLSFAISAIALGIHPFRGPDADAYTHNLLSGLGKPPAHG